MSPCIFRLERVTTDKMLANSILLLRPLRPRLRRTADESKRGRGVKKSLARKKRKRRMPLLPLLLYPPQRQRKEKRHHVALTPQARGGRGFTDSVSPSLSFEGEGWKWKGISPAHKKEGGEKDRSDIFGGLNFFFGLPIFLWGGKSRMFADRWLLT